MSSGGPVIPRATPGTITVTKASGVYTAVPVTGDEGTEYFPGDFVIVPGDQLGGATPANDALVTVTGTSGATHLMDTLSATSNAKTVYRIDLPQELGSFGITIRKSVSSYTVQSYTVGLNFRVNDSVTVLGTSLGGDTPANDAVVTITGVNGSGSITSLGVTGTAKTSYKVTLTQANASPGNTNVQPGGGGTVAAPTIVVSGTSYIASFVSAYPTGTDDGRMYAKSGTTPNTFYIKGSLLGGVDGVNDIVLKTVDVGSGVGELQGLSVFSGTANRDYSGFSIPAGDPATIDVDVSGTDYAVSVITGGSRYVDGQQYVITGDRLGGTTTTNDLTITVDATGGGAFGVGSLSGTPLHEYTPFLFPNSNYKFRQIQNRDASDIIAQKRQDRIRNNYKASSTDNKQTSSDPWFKFGNQFRLDYLLGRWKLRVANSDGFSTNGVPQ